VIKFLKNRTIISYDCHRNDIDSVRRRLLWWYDRNQSKGNAKWISNGLGEREV